MREIEFVVAGDLAGERLDRAIARIAGDLSNKQAKALVCDGHVRVGGTVWRKASRLLVPGEQVLATILAPAAAGLADLRDAVLYQDDAIIVVSKPSGLPTHQTHEPDRDHALAAVKRLLPDGAYVAVHHRLDVETSGVLLFVIDRDANKAVADAFAQRVVQKTYLAIVTSSDLSTTFVVDNHLGRDRHDTRRRRAVSRGGDHATTEFSLLGRSSGGALVQARPLTGRTHQIRVHLSGENAPIAGDTLYGAPQAAERLMLHAARLVLPHPVGGQPLDLAAPLPEDFRSLLLRMGLQGPFDELANPVESN